MIKLEDCTDGGTYKISSRNLTYGVFHKETSGFIGIREKFFNEYLFEEYHWDTGPPFGTVAPVKFIEMCPISPINEDNEDLFSYLKEIEKVHRMEGI